MVTLPILLERCPSELTETPLVAEAGYENAGMLDVVFLLSKLKKKEISGINHSRRCFDGLLNRASSSSRLEPG